MRTVDRWEKRRWRESVRSRITQKFDIRYQAWNKTVNSIDSQERQRRQAIKRQVFPKPALCQCMHLMLEESTCPIDTCRRPVRGDIMRRGKAPTEKRCWSRWCPWFSFVIWQVNCSFRCCVDIIWKESLDIIRVRVVFCSWRRCSGSLHVDKFGSKTDTGKCCWRSPWRDESSPVAFTLLSFGGKNPPFFLISGKQQNSTNTHPTMPVMGCISLIVLF